MSGTTSRVVQMSTSRRCPDRPAVAALPAPARSGGGGSPVAFPAMQPITRKGPVAPQGPCPVCGRVGFLEAKRHDVTVKRRPKFGFFFLILTPLFGLGFFLWLIWPRHRVVVSVDRYVQCGACGSRA